MKNRRYRFNRATGKIYQESYSSLIEIPDYLDAVILHATPPVYGQPFPNQPAQNWINLCFLDRELSWSFALLNSGQSEALRPFLNYKTQQKDLLNYLTRISLVPQRSRSGNHWYAYAFEALPLPDRVNPLEILHGHSGLPLIDPNISLDFPEPESDLQQLKTLNSPQVEVKFSDSRSNFLNWY
ncbi:hypothetical protein [Planktothrix sp. FACHB-1355]|nr:hypothetical protein [Planktothrix sp. FACHB-1355]